MLFQTAGERPNYSTSMHAMQAGLTANFHLAVYDFANPVMAIEDAIGRNQNRCWIGLFERLWQFKAMNACFDTQPVIS